MVTIRLPSQGIGVADTTPDVTSVQPRTPSVTVPIITTVGLPPFSCRYCRAAEVVHPSVASTVLPPLLISRAQTINWRVLLGRMRYLLQDKILPINKLQPPFGHFFCCECLYSFSGKNTIRKMALRCLYYDRRSKIQEIAR